MGAHPVEAVKKQKDSSIVVAAKLVKEGAADALVSAGEYGSRDGLLPSHLGKDSRHRKAGDQHAPADEARDLHPSSRRRRPSRLVARTRTSSP